MSWNRSRIFFIYCQKIKLAVSYNKKIVAVRHQQRKNRGSASKVYYGECWIWEFENSCNLENAGEFQRDLFFFLPMKGVKVREKKRKKVPVLCPLSRDFVVWKDGRNMNQTVKSTLHLLFCSVLVAVAVLVPFKERGQCCYRHQWSSESSAWYSLSKSLWSSFLSLVFSFFDTFKFKYLKIT